jgi:three-Cys-motif partner protein
MTNHKFGGNWTTEKLEVLSKYLRAYCKIFKSNKNAQYFETIYVDAFAGTGYRRVDTTNDLVLLPDLDQQDTQKYLKGSAVIALECEPSFDQYIFIEHKTVHIAELEQLKIKYPNHAVTVKQGDATINLRKLIENTSWKKHRAVVFLDPYGMQVDWSLIEVIAKTQAIDLWLLFPLGMGVNRLLTRQNEPPQEWADRLTRIFGTDSWRNEFYANRVQPTLFGEEEVRSIKTADFDSIGQFMINRLKTIFPGVAPKPLALLNSRGNPLYLLCFAAGNPKGAPTALKIAKHLLEN